ncbi:type II toxin-antitoxin system RelE/ParE family toxin [Campylobacter lari]|nr:type II toxin-antitoxin system RelE/ParE family toxin [Campylobacter lari]
MYEIKFSSNAKKSIEKLDQQVARIIKSWIIKNLIESDNPKKIAKELKGNLKGIYRFRVGNYRMLAEINDNELFVFVFEIGHRREIYKKFKK